MDINTAQHGQRLEDYQAEATALINLAMSGKDVLAKLRIRQMVAEVWNRNEKPGKPKTEVLNR